MKNSIQLYIFCFLFHSQIFAGISAKNYYSSEEILKWPCNSFFAVEIECNNEASWANKIIWHGFFYVGGYRDTNFEMVFEKSLYISKPHIPVKTTAPWGRVVNGIQALIPMYKIDKIKVYFHKNCTQYAEYTRLCPYLDIWIKTNIKTILTYDIFY